MAIEENVRVGKSAAIIKSLVQHVNEERYEPYIIEANPVVDPDTFWEFERANRGEITSVSFDLYAPNMFGLRSELDKELRELRDNEKARETKLTLENKDGLNLETERVHLMVDYTLEGGGNIRARTKRKKRYNSKQRMKKVTIEQPPAAGFLTRMRTAIGQLFGGTDT